MFKIPRNLIITIITLIFISALLFDYANCVNQTGLENLFNSIFIERNYNPVVRPVHNESGLTIVNTELKILQLDLDEKSQEFLSTVWIEMSWVDERLQWNPNDYDNITEITLPISRLWVPDIVLQNGVGKNEYLNEFKLFNPWIKHSGYITWVPEVRLRTKCSIKIANFPFDSQCCEINFYSWAHTIRQMKIQQYRNKTTTNITHLVRNTEWTVYDTCAFDKVIITNEDLHWSVTSYVIRIKREYAYYIYNLIMPCFVLSMVSALLFLLPSDSGEKITFGRLNLFNDDKLHIMKNLNPRYKGVTVLLAFFVNSLLISDYTPEGASEISIIGVYYVFNIAMVSISVGATVLVLSCHFSGHYRNSKVPEWLKRLLVIKPAINVNEILDDNGTFDKLSKNIKNIECTTKDDEKTNNPQIIQPLKDFGEINKERIKKILKLIRYSVKIIDENRVKLINFHMDCHEWKLVARRMDLFLFFIQMIIVIVTPLFLFGKIFFDEGQNFQGHQKKCQCAFN